MCTTKMIEYTVLAEKQLPTCNIIYTINFHSNLSFLRFRNAYVQIITY